MGFLSSARCLVVVCAVGVALVACSRVQPVYNVEDRQVPSIGQQMPTEAEVASAINRAASATNWSLEAVEPGHYRAFIRWQDHSAVADILYSRQSYSIHLNHSWNLKENDGQIHRRYNQYVQQLEDEIDRRLRLGVAN